MPPQAQVAVRPQNRLLWGVIVIAVLAVIGVIAGTWWNSSSSPLGYEWGSNRYLIQGKSGPAYLFSDGTFSVTERGVDSQALYTPAGWPPVVVEQTSDGLRACSAEVCEPLISFGVTIDRPVAFAVSGDLLLLIHPFAGDLQGYRLTPANPARVESVFIVSDLMLSDASSMVESRPGSGEYVYVQPMPSGFEVCKAKLSEDKSAFSTEACAPYESGASLRDAVITTLP